MCYPAPEQDGMSSRPPCKANHEPLLGDAAGRGVCFGMHPDDLSGGCGATYRGDAARACPLPVLPTGPLHCPLFQLLQR